MRRRPVFKSIEHARETGFDLCGRISGDGEGLVHDVRAMVADRSRRQLDPVADDVILVGGDCQGIVLFECGKTALRHRERVVAEYDFPGFLADFVHWEVNDPAEAVPALLDEIQLARNTGTGLAGEPFRLDLGAGGEKNDIASTQSR